MKRSVRAARTLAVASIGLAIAVAIPAGTRADPAAPKKSARSAHHHVRTAKAPGSSSVLLLSSCYGGFIAWRDELSGLMLQANSYTPWPNDRSRFDRMEHAFAEGVRRRRRVVLTLQPTFREADFPPDIRGAFQTGLKTATATFAGDVYRRTQRSG